MRPYIPLTCMNKLDKRKTSLGDVLRETCLHILKRPDMSLQHVWPDTLCLTLSFLSVIFFLLSETYSISGRKSFDGLLFLLCHLALCLNWLSISQPIILGILLFVNRQLALCDSIMGWNVFISQILVCKLYRLDYL